MFQRPLLGTLLFAAAIAMPMILPAAPAGGADQSAISADTSGGLQVADLRERLENGLKVRLPSEFAFIDRVVTLVELGRLPLAIVDSTFLWARPKRPYPFPYFERALRLRAAQIGVAL